MSISRKGTYEGPADLTYRRRWKISGDYLGALGHLPSGHAFARSDLQRSHGHWHRCSILPSGFHTPRTHDWPQSQALGLGGVGAGASTSIEARAAATAAAAFGTSRSADVGSDDIHARTQRIHSQNVSITTPGRCR